MTPPDSLKGLAERLRAYAKAALNRAASAPTQDFPVYKRESDGLNAAADAILALRSENARLRAVVEAARDECVQHAHRLPALHAALTALRALDVGL